MRQLTFWKHAAAHDTLKAYARGGVPAEPPPEGCGRDTEQLALWLSGVLQCPVALTFTRNRSVMVSYRRVAQGMRVRMHEVFLLATPAVLQAAVDFIGGSRAAGPKLDAYVLANASQVTPLHSLTPVTRGEHFDLLAVIADVNRRFFHGGCTASVSWAPKEHRPKGARKRPLMLGRYVLSQKLILIHRCLDSPCVPRFVVDYIMFHEMLHELFGLPEHLGSRLRHPSDFVLLESCYPETERAQAWLVANAARLTNADGHTPHQRGLRKIPPAVAGLA